MNNLIAWVRRQADARPDGDGDALRAALAEHQRLIRDTHHQVQNSLQIVASMIALQAHDSDSPEVAQMHAVIQAQIQTLTLVQRRMHGESSKLVELPLLMSELCTGLEASLASAVHPRVEIACSCAPGALLSPDLATPLGFLITELGILAAVNSPPGTLKVNVSGTAVANRIAVKVESAGFTQDAVAAIEGKSTARIILAMARQLHGPLVHDAAAGSYCVEFAASPA